MTNESDRISAWVPQEIIAALTARGILSEALREVLARYFALLEAARADLRERFAAAELGLLVDICQGTLWEAHTLCMVGQQAADAEDAHYERWGLERRDLLKKMRGLNLLQRAALVDAIERYWRASATGMRISHEGILG